MSFEDRRTLQSFIDDLRVPVVVLDSLLTPLCTNSSGKEAFHLLEDGMAHYSLGEIVECDNSKLPGGCGHTTHCSGCVLRKTVTETFNTGKRFSKVPATLTSNSHDVSYYVSAMKVGDCVVVKLDTQA